MAAESSFIPLTKQLETLCLLAFDFQSYTCLTFRSLAHVSKEVAALNQCIKQLQFQILIFQKRSNFSEKNLRSFTKVLTVVNLPGCRDKRCEVKKKTSKVQTHFIQNSLKAKSYVKLMQRPVKLLMQPAGRALTSGWSVNSFINVVYGEKF